jgi:SH3-like domain-containing protein
MIRQAKRGSRMTQRKALAATILLAATLASTGAAPAAQRKEADATGEAAFGSLKASEVNLRKGPGTEYPIAWVFRRAGLPVKIIRQFEAWREISDADGTRGWVLRTLLSARRTVQITPWAVKKGQPRVQEQLIERPRSGSRTVALIEAGVIADVHSCSGSWCHVSVGSYSGFIEQGKLWGVAKNEVLK